MKREYKCDCHNHEMQVCDICQGITPTDRDSEKEVKPDSNARTAENRGIKVAQNIFRKLFSSFNLEDRDQAAKMIAVEIESYATEYAAEKVREERVRAREDNFYMQSLKQVRAEGYRAGQIAMRERAANVMEFQIGNILETDWDRSLVKARISIIRYLSIEEKA